MGPLCLLLLPLLLLFAGLMCLLLGLVSSSLPSTMAVLVMLSVTCQQSAGLSFGVVPFVSKRSTGLVAGFVGAGGNVGELNSAQDAPSLPSTLGFGYVMHFMLLLRPAEHCCKRQHIQLSVHCLSAAWLLVTCQWHTYHLTDNDCTMSADDFVCA